MNQESPVNANSAVLMVRACPYVSCVGLPVLVEVGRRGVTGKGEPWGLFVQPLLVQPCSISLTSDGVQQHPCPNMVVLNNHLQGTAPGEAALARPSVHPWDICVCLASSSVFPALHMNS